MYAVIRTRGGWPQDSTYGCEDTVIGNRHVTFWKSSYSIIVEYSAVLTIFFFYEEIQPDAYPRLDTRTEVYVFHLVPRNPYFHEPS
jgi:hypothetical protein